MHVCENRRRNEETLFRNVSPLEGEPGFAFPDLDVLLDALVSGFIDDRSDGDAGLFRIADTQACCRGEQSLHHARIIFFENNKPRTSRTFLTLITECGINRIDNRFVEIGIGIDDDRVFAAHLAYDPLELALAFSRLPRALPNSQPHFARTGKRNNIDIFMIDKVRAHDRALAGQKI